MDFWFWLNSIANFTQLESYELLKKDANNNDLMKVLRIIFNQNKEIIKSLKEEIKMNEERSEYVGGGYRDYRGGYRMRNNRDDYRDENYREYDMRGGKINNRSYRNYRNYREDDIYEEIENAMYEAKECHRKFEDLSEMTDDNKIKSTLMKLAMREKEHYEFLKELLEK